MTIARQICILEYEVALSCKRELKLLITALQNHLELTHSTAFFLFVLWLSAHSLQVLMVLELMKSNLREYLVALTSPP